MDWKWKPIVQECIGCGIRADAGGPVGADAELEDATRRTLTLPFSLRESHCCRIKSSVFSDILKIDPFLGVRAAIEDGDSLTFTPVGVLARAQYMGLAQIPWLLAKGTTGLYFG